MIQITLALYEINVNIHHAIGCTENIKNSQLNAFTLYAMGPNSVANNSWMQFWTTDT